MKQRFVFFLTFAACVMPVPAATLLQSSVTVPKAVTQPPPSSLRETVTRYDNQPVSVSVATTAGSYASGFAQSDFGVLRASVTNFVGLGYSIYRYESQASAVFQDDIFMNVPTGQTMARLVFSYSVQQTHAPDVNSWEQLNFLASVVSRPGSGVGLLGTAYCGTSGTSGSVDSSGSFGYLSNLNIPLTATCTLDTPVTAGEQVKLEIYSHLLLVALGTNSESALDATHTVAVTSTGWVDGSGNFTPSAFTGASGATYPYVSEVPEPASFGLVGMFLIAATLRFRSRKW